MNDYIPRKALLDWVHEFYPDDKVLSILRRGANFTQ